jgi:Plasmid encoded RepA protein
LLKTRVMKDRDAAHGVHQLVLLHGHERAREMVPERQRPLVDIAAEVLADERQNIGISYTGFCLTSLPHKRLPESQAWQKHGHRVTLLVEPGRLKTTKGELRLYGVPYGARARMILLYLQTQAVRTNSPQVALGRSVLLHGHERAREMVPERQRPLVDIAADHQMRRQGRAAACSPSQPCSRGSLPKHCRAGGQTAWSGNLNVGSPSDRQKPALT